jgi:hypothetical protein
VVQVRSAPRGATGEQQMVKQSVTPRFAAPRLGSRGRSSSSPPASSRRYRARASCSRCS